MKRNTAILLILMLLGTTTFAQQNYSASLIPPELMPYASAVVRSQEVTIQVKGLDEVMYHEKKAITILNKNGEDAARITLFYDGLSAVKDVKGVCYDEFGKPISKFSEGKMEDEYAYDGFSLFLDRRVKRYVPPVTSYPYTIEYEYDIRNKQSLDFDQWEPVDRFGLAIEKSSFTFICKPDYRIRYKEFNLADKVIEGTTKEGLKTYSWHVANVKAFRQEPFSPELDTYTPSVKVAPEKFSFGGMTGTFTNWQQLGKWMYDNLQRTQTELSPATMQLARDLVKDIPDPKMKAKKIYEYMQQSTHYVSVQVGIGGLQPISAGDVDRVHYGDCKGLANYTKALLNAAGVDSWYCEVKAGQKYNTSLLPNFASADQSNHIILCLPFKNDTTWLECTDQYCPFGYLGDFTDDRTVLAWTPEGGKLIHTPKFTPQQSLESRKAVFAVSDAGELSGEMTTSFKGSQYDNRYSEVTESSTERLKQIKEQYPINNLEIEKLDLKQDKSLDPVTTEYIKLSASEYASATNGRISFLVNPANRILNAPRDIRNRRTNVQIVRGYTDEDEITYTLPAGYKLERLPLNKHIEKPFGRFEARIEFKGDKLVYKRKFELLDGTYNKDTYQDLVDFYDAVADADAYSAELVKGN